MSIKLTLKETPTVPLEAEVLSPSHLAELSHSEICGLRLYHGKRQMRVDDFFDVEGERSDQVEIHGDLRRVRLLGRAMTRGHLSIHGSVGMHLGAHMKGGRIDVYGDASDWIGAEMTNGFIHVHGNGGGQIGGGYRGSLRGMKNGTIVIGGIVKDFCGLQMKGGTIVLQSGAEIRTGAWMNRGTIISLVPLQLMPTFQLSCYYNPTFLNVYGRYLMTMGIRLPWSAQDGSWARYYGDCSVPGKGEIFIWNPHGN